MAWLLPSLRYASLAGASINTAVLLSAGIGRLLRVTTPLCGYGTCA